MKSAKIKFLLCGLFFVVLAVLTFRCAWPADHVFSASDLNIGRLAWLKNNTPESFIGYFSSKPVMGGTSAGFKVFTLLLAAIPLELFANTIYGFILVIGSISMVWFLRLWNRSWTAALFGSLVAFWFNSIMLATGGHAYKMEVLVCSVICLCLAEKSIRAVAIKQAIGYALLCGISAGIMMIEQQDVALLAGLFIACYTLFRLIQVHLKSFVRWVALLLPIATIALLLSGNTVLKSYNANIKGSASVQGSVDEKWNYVTQWSMVPGEWPDLVASGWSGWGSNDPKGPYWGKIGQSAEWESTKQGFRNFKITSVYFGIIPFLLGAFGMGMAIRNRKEEDGKVMLFWSIAGMLGLWLAFGKYSLLYKLFFQLPMVGNIRAPMKFLDNFQICLGIISAYGLDHLISSAKGQKAPKVLWISCAGVCGLMVTAGLRYLLAPDGKIELFKSMGYGNHAEVMVQNMSSAWFHAALLAFICAVLSLIVWKGFKQAKWIGAVFVVVLAADSLSLTSHYFKASDISVLKKGNILTDFIKHNQGDERTFFVDQSGIYNQWLASDGSYHQLNIFNIWQMPRMPVEYKEFLGTVGRNQMRLWELSAIKYIAAPASVLQQLSKQPGLAESFQPVLNYQVPTAQGMRQDVVLEFKRAIPRFSLYTGWDIVPLEKHCEILASQAHDPHQKLLVADVGSGLSAQSGGTVQSLQAEITKRKATLKITTTRPAIVRFAQRWQPGWSAFVNGQPADLLRVDYLSMGVQIPAGDHEVEFRCLSESSSFFFSIGLLLIASIGGFALVTVSRKSN